MNKNMATYLVENQNMSSASPMKQSQSLNSLPPSNGQQDVSDITVAAKLLIERPYNSLKVSILNLIYKMQLSEKFVANNIHMTNCSICCNSNK